MDFFGDANVALEGKLSPQSLQMQNETHGYCFGLHLNFDAALDSQPIQAEVERNGDLAKPYPHRRFARWWLNADYEEGSAKSAATKRRQGRLSTGNRRRLAAALVREDIDIESLDTPLAVDQPRIRHANPWRVDDAWPLLLPETHAGPCPETAFLLRPGSPLRAACLAAFRDEIRNRTADAFYVGITEDLAVDEKRHRYNDAKVRFEQARAEHPGMQPQAVKLLLIKECLQSMSPHGKWQDRWLDHPFPTMSEPEKAVAYLTDIGDYDQDHKAWLYNKASLRGVDSFFNQARRRSSQLERPIRSKANKGRVWNG